MSHPPYPMSLWKALRTVPGHLSWPEGLKLYHLAWDCDPALDILEVGSFAGRSTACLVHGLLRPGAAGKVLALDCWTPEWAGMQVQHAHVQPSPEDLAGSIERAFDHHLRPWNARLEKVKGWSDQVLPTLAPGRFGLIFLDGCHKSPQVDRDLAHLLPLRPRVLAMHDWRSPKHLDVPAAARAAGLDEPDQIVDSLAVFCLEPPAPRGGESQP